MLNEKLDVLFTTELLAKADLHALYELLGWNAFLKLTEDQIFKAAQQSFCSLYVYKECQLIATGRIISDGVINAYICGVGVLPEYRCHGIGSEIVNRLVVYSKERGLHTQLLCDEDHAKYYKQLGFKPFTVGMKI